MKANYNKYDVVLVDFGKNVVGSEQGGIRPAVLVQNKKGNLNSTTTIVMPFSTCLKRSYIPTHSLFKKGKDKGLARDSMLLGECMKQISELRIKKYLGKITSDYERKEIKRVYDANFND